MNIYTAPEVVFPPLIIYGNQITDEERFEHTHKRDIWALGVVLHNMMFFTNLPEASTKIFHENSPEFIIPDDLPFENVEDAVGSFTSQMSYSTGVKHKYFTENKIQAY